MKKLLIIATVILTLATGCDLLDSGLEDRVNDLESRVTKLEQLCAEMNTNISSLQTIVNALKDNDYITGVEPVYAKDGEQIGYKISFSKSGNILIYNGNDGKDGHTPVIGVAKGADGIYYWTVDGEWLRDADGNKIRAEGSGNNIPKLKIENDYWYVSYDNGVTWERLGKAVADGGNSFFKDVIVSENEIKLILADGTELIIPRGAELSVKFNFDSSTEVAPLSEHDITFEIISSSETIEVEMLTSMDLSASLKMKDKNHGSIHVTFGSVLSDDSKIILIVSDGFRVVMESLQFSTTGISIVGDPVQNVSAKGGDLTLKFYANVSYTCRVSEDARSWIELPPDTKAMDLKTLTVYVKKNSGAEREGRVIISSEDKKIEATFIIRQQGAGASDNPFTGLKNIGFYKMSGETVTDKIDYVSFESQYLMVDPFNGFRSFAIISPKDKYLCVDKIPAEPKVGNETTLEIKQNYSSVKAEDFSLTCKLLKQSADTLWFYNENLSEGIILKIR